MTQLLFPVVMSWKLQPVPHTLRTKQTRLAKQMKRDPNDRPVEPNLIVIKELFAVGCKRLPQGHSRRKTDTPRQQALNQLQWVKLDQISLPQYLANRESYYIAGLLEYGFAEQRYCKRFGKRYRLSWYGQKWLEAHQKRRV